MKMTWEDYMTQGLNGDAPLKLILCGGVEQKEKERVGVVSVVYATQDKTVAEKKLRELAALHPEHYYMVYSVPLDQDLTALAHYPSIEITREDLAG